jgi:ribonuclease Z
MAAFRYTEEGRSLLITGDTVKSANVQKFAGDVDLLVHEALATNLVEMAEKVAEKTGNSSDVKMMHGIRDYPTSPLEAAETARDSGIEHLLCRHTVPPLVFLEQKMLLLNGAELFFQITRLASMVWPFHCGRIRMKSFATVKGCSQA